jgi:hypothetical protein
LFLRRRRKKITSPIIAAMATMDTPTPIPAPAAAERPGDDFAEFDCGDDALPVDAAVDGLEPAWDEAVVVAFDDPEVVCAGEEEEVAAASFDVSEGG